MTRAFILIDALPNRESEVLDAVRRVAGVVSARRLPQRVGQGDVIALVEAGTPEDLERLLANRLREVPNVHNIIRVQPTHTLMAPVQAVMEDMRREADAGRKA